MALQRFDALCERFPTALHESAAELAAQGFAKASELEQRVLQTGGVRSVSDKLL